MSSAKAELNRFVKADDAIGFAVSVLTKHQVSHDDAVAVADCLVEADLRGVQTHGLSRLPVYIERLQRGMMNPRPAMTLATPTAVCGSLDGDNGFGFLVGRRGMAEAMAMASDYGVGIVAAHNSNHFGMAASYLLQAVKAGYIAFVFTNAATSMPPWGGREGLFGTNPFAAGAPSGNAVPFILDMSPAVAARGKIRLAEKRGESIPEGYALDKDGKNTTDPKAALAGVVLPIGGHKGSGLSMLMDILSGVLSGAGFAGGVNDQYHNWDDPQNVGHFFMALKPGVFITEQAFRDRMDLLVQRVKAVPLADGFDEILMPGEKEARLAAQRLQNGIPYAAADLALLEKLAVANAVAPLAFTTA
jgi:LDH2 family malate/lactate/ureidoglycolate dehydrogenase